MPHWSHRKQCWINSTTRHHSWRNDQVFISENHSKPGTRSLVCARGCQITICLLYCRYTSMSLHEWQLTARQQLNWLLFFHLCCSVFTVVPLILSLLVNHSFDSSRVMTHACKVSQSSRPGDLPVGACHTIMWHLVSLQKVLAFSLCAWTICWANAISSRWPTHNKH